ncbi:hypothetical protein B0H13DRAFT_1861156 [Mycena leptocephala]|nr:hypothetical protein B0H13DRAFT_1861156 [Mycena leptocephala]
MHWQCVIVSLHAFFDSSQGNLRTARHAYQSRLRQLPNGNTTRANDLNDIYGNSFRFFPRSCRVPGPGAERHNAPTPARGPNYAGRDSFGGGSWYFAGCFALLFWDFFLTLDDEVEWIWKGKKATSETLVDNFLHNLTPFSVFYVFLINRYCPPAFCIITLFGMFSCHDLADALITEPVSLLLSIVELREWLQTLLIVVPAEVVLLLRVFALTNGNKYLFTFLASIILVECTVVFYAMSLPGTNNGIFVSFPAKSTTDFMELWSYPTCPLILFTSAFCTRIPRYRLPRDTAYLSTSIAFDCIVFATTLACTMNHNIRRLRSSILPTIRWDGTLYFCVILLSEPELEIKLDRDSGTVDFWHNSAIADDILQAHTVFSMPPVNPSVSSPGLYSSRIPSNYLSRAYIWESQLKIPL